MSPFEKTEIIEEVKMDIITKTKFCQVEKLF